MRLPGDCASSAGRRPWPSRARSPTDRTPPAASRPARRDLVEEPGGRVPLRRPPRRPHHGPRQVQPLAGAGDTDVGEPPLLLQLLGVAQRAHVREDAVLETGEEDDRELQPLRGVQRHQRHHAAIVGRVRDLVGVGHQRHLLEELRQGPLRAARPRTRGPPPRTRRGSPPVTRPAGHARPGSSPRYPVCSRTASSSVAGPVPASTSVRRLSTSRTKPAMAFADRGASARSGPTAAGPATNVTRSPLGVAPPRPARPCHRSPDVACSGCAATTPGRRGWPGREGRRGRRGPRGARRSARHRPPCTACPPG